MSRRRHLVAVLTATLLAGCGRTPQASSPAAERWLGDFEDADEGWRGHRVDVTWSTQHATHGRRSARLSFRPASVAAFALADPWLGKRLGDWRPYRQLRLDLRSGEREQQRLLLQIEDSRGATYKEEIYLAGGARESVSVRLEAAARHVDLADLDEIRLFRWSAAEPATIYLDAVRLVPTGAVDPPGGEVRGSSPVPGDRWRAGWTHGLVKVFPDPARAPALATGPIEIALARGERESFQVVVVGARDRPSGVRLTAAALSSLEGSTPVPELDIEIRRVAYVVTRRPPYPVEAVGPWPDPLPLGNEVEVAAGRLQPFWVTVTAGKRTAAGRYHSALRLHGTDGTTVVLRLEVRVWDFDLPEAARLRTAFDLYRGRLERTYATRVPGGAAWNGKTEELERLYLLDLLHHRISPVLGADPLQPDFPAGMQAYLAAGLNAFGVGAREGSNHWPRRPDEVERTKGWHRRAASELRAQGLLERAYVYAYDEPRPGLADTARVLELLHDAAPDLRRLVALDRLPDPTEHAAWLRHADILAIRLNAYDVGVVEALRRQGKETWTYVSAPGLPFPSLVIDYPAIAHRILPWMCWRLGFSGLLYWCVDYWTGDPWRDPAGFAGQNGNGSLVYPGPLGPVPSLRLEVLRDGIEDYDYLSLLTEKVAALRRQASPPEALLARAERLLAVDPAIVASAREYGRDPAPLLRARLEMGAVLEELGRVPASPASRPAP